MNPIFQSKSIELVWFFFFSIFWSKSN